MFAKLSFILKIIIQKIVRKVAIIKEPRDIRAKYIFLKMKYRKKTKKTNEINNALIKDSTTISPAFCWIIGIPEALGNTSRTSFTNSVKLDLIETSCSGKISNLYFKFSEIYLIIFRQFI